MVDVTSAVKDMKVSADLVDLILAGIVKYFSEKALNRFVGNGNIVSGLTKLGIGVGIDVMGGSSRLAKVSKTAMVLDGVEDIVTYSMKRVSGMWGDKMMQSNAIPTI